MSHQVFCPAVCVTANCYPLLVIEDTSCRIGPRRYFWGVFQRSASETWRKICFLIDQVRSVFYKCMNLGMFVSSTLELHWINNLALNEVIIYRGQAIKTGYICTVDHHKRGKSKPETQISLPSETNTLDMISGRFLGWKCNQHFHLLLLSKSGVTVWSYFWSCTDWLQMLTTLMLTLQLDHRLFYIWLHNWDNAMIVLTYLSA